MQDIEAIQTAFRGRLVSRPRRCRLEMLLMQSTDQHCRQREEGGDHDGSGKRGGEVELPAAIVFCKRLFLRLFSDPL